MEITTELLTDLREKSKLATGGTWTWEDDPPTLYAGRGQYADHNLGCEIGFHGLNLLGRLEPDWNGKNNLNFITAASPDVILALLDYIDKLANA